MTLSISQVIKPPSRTPTFIRLLPSRTRHLTFPTRIPIITFTASKYTFLTLSIISLIPPSIRTPTIITINPIMSRGILHRTNRTRAPIIAISTSIRAFNTLQNIIIVPPIWAIAVTPTLAGVVALQPLQLAPSSQVSHI